MPMGSMECPSLINRLSLLDIHSKDIYYKRWCIYSILRQVAISERNKRKVSTFSKRFGSIELTFYWHVNLGFQVLFLAMGNLYLQSVV